MNRITSRSPQPVFCYFQCNDLTHCPLMQNSNSSTQKKKIRLSKGLISNESSKQSSGCFKSNPSWHHEKSKTNLTNPKQIEKYPKQHSSIKPTFQKVQKIINETKAPNRSAGNSPIHKIKNNTHNIKSNNTSNIQNSKIKSQLQNLVHKSTITIQDSRIYGSNQKKQSLINQSKIMRKFLNVNTESKFLKSQKSHQQEVLNQANLYIYYR